MDSLKGANLLSYLVLIIFAILFLYQHKSNAFEIKHYNCWGDNCDPIQSWGGSWDDDDGDDDDDMEEKEEDNKDDSWGGSRGDKGGKEKGKSKGKGKKKGKKGKKEKKKACKAEVVAIKKTRIVPVAVPVRKKERTYIKLAQPMIKSHNWQPQGDNWQPQSVPMMDQAPTTEEEVIEEVIEEQPIEDDSMASDLTLFS